MFWTLLKWDPRRGLMQLFNVTEEEIFELPSPTTTTSIADSTCSSDDFPLTPKGSAPRKRGKSSKKAEAKARFISDARSRNRKATGKPASNKKDDRAPRATKPSWTPQTISAQIEIDERCAKEAERRQVSVLTNQQAKMQIEVDLAKEGPRREELEDGAKEVQQ